MSNSIVSHVNGGIRERFNNKLRIPRKLCSKSRSSWASPFFQPIKGFFKFSLSLRIISLKVIRFNMFFYIVFPLFFTIGQEPLITESNNALVSRSWYNFIFWFIIRCSKVIVHHIFFNENFCFLNFHIFTNSCQHNTFIKTFQIYLIFSFCKLIFVFLRLNFHIIY